jgi:hypothetical protein
VELQKAMLAVSPERIWNLRVLSRTHTAMGRTLLAAGDAEGGLASLNEALGVAERMLKRAPSSLYHQLDRAEVLEALGRHYTTLARRPGISAERGAAWKAEAGAAYRKSAAIWEEWVTRGVASPYAERRLARVSRAER